LVLGVVFVQLCILSLGGVFVFFYWCLLFYCTDITLVTKIDDTTIQVKFSPFQREGNIINSSEIKTIPVIQYQTMKDYFGWGLRNNFKNRTVAYTVSGNQGIEVTKLGGEKFLIGTRSPERVKNHLKLL
jgi:hypothetical protein